MGNQTQSALDLGSRPTLLSISMIIGSIPLIFWVILVQHWKEIFVVSEISADPQKRPYGVKRFHIGPKMVKNLSWNLTKVTYKKEIGKKKTHTGFVKLSKTKSHYPPNLGVGRNFCGLVVFVNILSCRIFSQKYFLVIF